MQDQVQGGGGLALWFTGLPGSGKSTLGAAVTAALAGVDDRLVTFLDGDIVRRVLSRGVGFSKADRCDNVCRIGYAASLIVRHGGIAVVAAVSPYRSARADAREMVTEAGGDFVEIYMDTPFALCVRRDPKGLYARALAGEIELFTGVDDPYEKPLTPELRVRTEACDSTASAADVLSFLASRRYIVGRDRRSAQ